MATNLFSLSSTTFAFVSAYTALTSLRCFYPPNQPRAQDKQVRDSIQYLYNQSLLELGRIALTVLFLWHSLASLCGSEVGTPSCPLHPPLTFSNYPFQTLNTTLFTWNRISISAFGIAIPAALFRLQAFKDLGADFTFELHAPQKLKTTGLYAYVQHPSYPALLIVFAFVTTWFLRHDGILGTLLPLPGWAWELWKGYGFLGTVYMNLMVVVVVWTRVREEESMLKEKFGKEWVEWNRRTARFVPFVF